MTQPVSLIFDLDGTLVDSLRDIAESLNAALAEMRRAPVSIDHVREWIGDGLTMLCRRALGLPDEAAAQELARLSALHYKSRCVLHTEPYRNILPMLKLLTETGCPLSVLSNKPNALTLQVIEGLNLARYFVAVRGSNSEEDRKPSPHSALALANQMGCRPSDVFLVGDSPVDIETARRAGMKSVAVGWGFRGREELAAEHPNYFIGDPLELLSIVGIFSS